MSNDFIPFAVGGSANVTPQATYAANTTLTQGGFASGIAKSPDLNKVWRQSSIMSAVVAQFIVNQTGANATDDGTTATLIANLLAAVQATSRAAVSGVIGQARNLVMSVTAASATATLTADEIVVETALGGVRYCLPSFSKTINLATTGAGGMDTGSAPANGFVALYAIYNPTTSTAALLAQNASTLRGNVYSGANMPAGYTASALVGVWKTNASSQFIAGTQRDRKISIASVTLLSTSTTQATPTALSISTVVPPNAITIGGSISAASSSGGSSTLAFLGADANLSGQVEAFGGATAGAAYAANYEVDLATAQTVYYEATNVSGTPTFTYTCSTYKF